MRYLLLSLLPLALCACNQGSSPSSSTSSTAATSPPAAEQPPPAAEPPHHHANLTPTQGNQAQGTVEFIPTEGSVLHVTGTITGLPPNSVHGFHIHEKGDCSAPDASSAGGHFNPTSQPHGNPSSATHHAGDMPNVTADAQGTAQVDIQLTNATIATGEPNDILGKAVVLHAKEDDYKSQPAGNSGARIACGVIQ